MCLFFWFRIAAVILVSDLLKKNEVFVKPSLIKHWPDKKKEDIEMLSQKSLF